MMTCPHVSEVILVDENRKVLTLEQLAALTFHPLQGEIDEQVEETDVAATILDALEKLKDLLQVIQTDGKHCTIT